MTDPYVELINAIRCLPVGQQSFLSPYVVALSEALQSIKKHGEENLERQREINLAINGLQFEIHCLTQERDEAIRKLNEHN